MITRAMGLSVIVGLLLSLTTLVVAEDAPKKGAKKAAQKAALVGKIVSVAEGSIVVKPKTGDNVTVTVNDATSIKVDGKSGKLSDLKEGMRIQVSNVDGPAKSIKANTAKPGKQGAKKQKERPEASEDDQAGEE